MGVAALLCWLVTAFAGLYLLAVWLIENDVTDQGATASRLPLPVILGHVVLALAGLAFWVLYLVFDSDTAGWCALGALVLIAALGVTMFTRWIPVHIAYVAAETGKHGRPSEFDFPAERAFPLPVVLGHAAMYGPQGSFMSELFSARVRYSGASLGYQLASIFAGGLSPLVATWLLAYGKGEPTYIAYYMILLVAITTVSVYLAKESHKSNIGA